MWNDLQQRRRYNSTYYEKNKELLKEKQRQRNKVRAERMASDPEIARTEREAQSARQKRWRDKNPERVAANAKRCRERDPQRARANYRRWALKTIYGITEEEYQRMVVEQDGKCKLCGGPPNGRWPVLNVDHVHGTKIIRGLLCHNCNTAIGLLNEDVSLVMKAVEYLKTVRTE